nr:FAD-dependent monooxygenase [Pseudonocardia acaciae]
MIVGAGPSGATAAACLARRGWRVAVVGPRPGAVARGETLAAEARSVLAGAGLWELVERLGRPCHSSWSVWGTPWPHRRDPLAGPWGPPWHVDVGRLTDALLDLAVRFGARLYPGRARVGRGGAPAAVSFELDGGQEEVTAGFLLDASGRAALGARAFGASRLTVDHQVAVTTWMRVDSPAVSTLVEATETGWWSTLADAGRLYLNYFTDPDLLPRPLALDAELRGAPHTAARVRAAGRGARPRLAVTSGSVLNRVAGCGWAAIGDAAATFDPLAGMGLHHALNSAVTAADAVHGALLGTEDGLDDYARSERDLFHEHLRARRRRYAAEGRWADRPFWRRRTRRVVPERPARRPVSLCPC